MLATRGKFGCSFLLNRAEHHHSKTTGFSKASCDAECSFWPSLWDSCIKSSPFLLSPTPARNEATKANCWFCKFFECCWLVDALENLDQENMGRNEFWHRGTWSSGSLRHHLWVTPASFILGDIERGWPLLGACAALRRILTLTWALRAGKSDLTASRNIRTPRNIWENTCSAWRIRQHRSQYRTYRGPDERWTEHFRAVRKSYSVKHVADDGRWDGKKSCLRIYLTAILIASNFVLYWTIAYWDKAARSFFWMLVR